MIRFTLGLSALLFLGGCVSEGGHQRDCAKIGDKLYRDQCYADAVLEAQRDISKAAREEVRAAKAAETPTDTE